MKEYEMLYWVGNIAKTKVISRVLRQLAERGNLTVFDYGCGKGGDWPAILADFPNLRWYGYEPHGPSYLIARERLAACPGAAVLTGRALDEADFRADIVVSFSVLEHVYDRREYLANARRLMADDGLFFLNYDDGHFRQYLDLAQTSGWGGALREHLHNIAAPWLAKLGGTGRFQQRVVREEIDALVSDLGFRIESAEYNNLVALKRLFKTLPPERHQDFVRFWLQVEESVNSAFRADGPPSLGDTANLWREMTSRTLVLRTMPRSAESGEPG